MAGLGGQIEVLGRRGLRPPLHPEVWSTQRVAAGRGFECQEPGRWQGFPEGGHKGASAGQGPKAQKLRTAVCLVSGSWSCDGGHFTALCLAFHRTAEMGLKCKPAFSPAVEKNWGVHGWSRVCLCTLEGTLRHNRCVSLLSMGTHTRWL